VSTPVAARTDHSATDTDKVRLILQRARDIFMHSGYGAASMDAVARAAGVSKATLYMFFAGKRELFAAVILEERNRYAVSLLSGEATRESVRAKLMRFGEAIVNFLISEETVASFRMVVGEAARAPELGRLFYENGPSRLLDRLEAFLHASMTRGELRKADPRRAAEQLIGLVRGDLQLRALLGITGGSSRAHVKAIVRDGVDTFYRAYTQDYRGSDAPRQVP
jgi:TetR/AcrR family transcriptional regulator, mexJK operon transcriptional repressor